MKKILSLVVVLVMTLCSLSALAQTVPSEYVGDWVGRVEELDIDLSFTIRADGSGTFVFKQRGYTDARDFSFRIDDSTFTLSPGTDGSTSSGTFTLEDGVLTLDLETHFANGRTYSYQVKCERVVSVEEIEGLFGKESDFLSEDGAELRGFDSAETCAKAVAQALIKGDAEAFLDCYAIKETASGFNMIAYLEKVGSVDLRNMLMPPVNEFSVAYNEARLTNTLLMSVAVGSLTLTKPEIEKLWGRLLNIRDYSAQEITAIATSGDELSRLSYQGTMKPSDLNDRYETALEKGGWRYAVHGARAWDETIVMLKLDDRTQYLPLGLVRYRGGWLASPLTPIIAMLSGMPPYTLLMSDDMMK